jgi:hypothetical protein
MIEIVTFSCFPVASLFELPDGVLVPPTGFASLPPELLPEHAAKTRNTVIIPKLQTRLNERFIVILPSNKLFFYEKTSIEAIQ